MRRFVLGFVLLAPLLLWLSATVALVATAPIWLSFPTCCVIDDAAMLVWLSILPKLYVFGVFPAAFVACLLFKLHVWHGEFEPIAMFMSLLVALVGFFLCIVALDVEFKFYESIFDATSLVFSCAIFGILFVSTALSALMARRLSRNSIP